MATAYEKALAALQEAAEADDANGAAAKKALAALVPPPPEEGDDAEKKKKDEEAAAAAAALAAEGGGSDADDEKKKKEESASASAVALKALREVHTLRAELAKERTEGERERLIASRDDFETEMVAMLQKAPIEIVRDAVKTLPKGSPVSATAQRGAATGASAKTALAAAQPGVAATRGNTQRSEGTSQLPADEKRALDIRMGLVASTPGVRNTDYKLTLGELVPASEAANGGK